MNKRVKAVAARVVCCMGAALAVSQPGAARAEELFWDGVPLGVSLRTGVERTVLFPSAVRDVQLPESVVRQLRTQSADRAVHWRAGVDFDPVRVIVNTIEGGVYFIDLQASAEGPVEPLKIHNPHAPAGLQAERGLRKPAELLLTRFAAQELYAPDRLRPRGRTIFRYPIGDYPKKFPLIRGVDFSYEILGGWRGHGLHVTALRVTNHSSLRVPLDPRFLQHNRIRGDWRASTFHHLWLEPAGSAGEADTTVLYLVSEDRFERSLRRVAPAAGKPS